jgi:Protein of unknown function (DUF3306)
MSDPGAFLSRWSRRKLAARSPPAPEAESAPADPVAAPQASAGEPDPDLSALPPIDDIVADTDISAFLKPGVPVDLTRSALRRAWSADTAIRDFVGPADYAWDFNAPDAMAGFGALGLSDALREEMVQALFSTPEEPEMERAEAERELETYPEASCPQVPPPRVAAAPPAMSEALIQNTTPSIERDAAPRHGGALPK